MIIGHRGAAGLAPENTLSAIKKAIEYGVEGIEIDVRQSSDGVLVLMHNSTVDATTNGKGSVRALSYDRLRKLDASHTFTAYKGEKIPTLEEVMELINGRVKLFIEIKTGDPYYPNLEINVSNMIQKYKAYDWCCVLSFKDEVLQKMREVDNKVELHKLMMMQFPLLPFMIDYKLRAHSIKKYDFVDAINVNYNFATRSIIRKAHKMGKKVNVWTVNDSIKIRRLISLGVDGIITDYPNYLDKNEK